jgi:lipopolysaccharide heptosyltransferase II
VIDGLRLMHTHPPALGSSKDLSLKAADQAALGALVRFSSRKRQFIRAVEMIANPCVTMAERFRTRPRPADDGAVKKILVVEYWNLGDFVMESPFLRSLRIQYPDSRITLLTSPKVAPLVEHQGLVDEVIVVRVPWTEHYSRWRKYNPFSALWIELVRTLNQLRAKDIDLAFSARADLRDNFVLWYVNATRRVGYAFGGGGCFLTDIVTPDLQNPHFSSRWLRLLDAVGKKPLVREPRLQLTAEQEMEAERCLAKCGVEKEDFLVAVHPGARSPIREWGHSNFTALARKLQAEFPVKFIWFQDPGRPMEPLEKNIGAHSLALPVREFMAVLAKCRLLICNDSGPMHIATALRVPVVAIFGPTQPIWFGPLGRGHQVIIQPGFWCRPCFDYCLFDQPYCLRTIDVDMVYQACSAALTTLSARNHESNAAVYSTVAPNEEVTSNTPALESNKARRRSGEL